MEVAIPNALVVLIELNLIEKWKEKKEKKARP